MARTHARPVAWCAARMLLASLLVSCAAAQGPVDSAGSMSLMPHLGPSMDTQQRLAQRCVDRWESKPAETLAAVYLHAHLASTWRDKLLTCSIDHLLRYVGQHTPLDIYVFVRHEMYSEYVETLPKQLGERAGRLCVLPIPPEQWAHQQPRATQYMLPNNTNRYGDYLVMGQWRMLVPLNIMAALGYPYVVQVDDDLYITQPFEVNIVDHMRSNGQKVGTHRVSFEKGHIMHGLAELARFFLTSNNLQPGGSLISHLQPQDISGLHSPRNDSSNLTSPSLGYDRSVLWGNFLIMSTDLWREPAVQDWVALCLGSGGLERHRWQEQGVMSFIWLLFTEEHELWKLQPPEFNYIHGRDPDDTKRMCGVVNPVILARHRRAATGPRHRRREVHHTRRPIP